MKKINKKGFTLVEIIVVLVILAILAAATIPTMLGYIDEAKGKANIAEARIAYVSAQTIATEMSAFDYSNADIVQCIAVAEGANGELTTSLPASGTPARDMREYSNRFKRLIGQDVLTSKTSVTSIMDSSAGKVASVKYVKDGYIVTLTAGGESIITKDTKVK